MASQQLDCIELGQDVGGGHDRVSFCPLQRSQLGGELPLELGPQVVAIPSELVTQTGIAGGIVDRGPVGGPTPS